MKKTQTGSAVVPARGAAAVQRTNEFAGMSEDARVELALVRIRSEWVNAAGAFLKMGHTTVDACHDGDEHAALADDADGNRVFGRIARSLGTLAGGPDRRTISLARRVAAASRLVPGHFWDVVPYSHKEILVVLKEPARIAAGAKRAVDFGWTLDQTRKFVDEERAQAGSPKKKRGARLGTARTALGRLALAGEPESLERIATEFERLDEAGRERVRAELDEARAALQRLYARLRKRDR